MQTGDYIPKGIELMLVYGIFVLAFLLSLRLVRKYPTPYKPELMILAWYLMTGAYNQLLTFKIPGISFFEIQPDRFLLLTFTFFLFRRFLQKGLQLFPGRQETVPLFKVMLFLFVGSLIISQATYVQEIGFAELVVQVTINLTIIVLIVALPLMADEHAFRILGQAFIIGAVFTCIISLVQLGTDHAFMRYGEGRPAFGSVIRSIGMFKEDYTNSYFMITGIFWVLTTQKNPVYKYLLMGLLLAGILTTFHRMSWLIAGVTLSIYFLWIDKIGLDRLALVTLSGLALALCISIVAYRDIANSTLVKERLSDSIDGRKGYWNMVMENIGDKPIFGFGSKDNDVYYYNMLLVTKDRKRASGATGDIHNGYLQAMFFYGIPTFLFFVLFVFSALFYFARLLPYHLFFAVPFLFSLLYAMANFTNNFLFGKQLAIICAIHFALGLGARRLPGYFLPASTDSPPAHNI